MFPIDGGVIDFQSLIIDNLAANRMWVTTVCRCGGIDSIERLSKARPIEGVIGDWVTSEIRLKISFQKLFRSTQLQKI